MSSPSKPLNDESLRELAASDSDQASMGNAATARDAAASSSDLSAMEDSLK
jgi:hypothetical protein